MNKDINEKISILLASYNGSKFISEQIDSILLQTYSNFELLICDDCSTDNTYQILEKYIKKDNRIKIFRNEENLGFKKNFEHLLELASCKYIALSDQDDIWTIDHLDLLMSNIGDNDLICGNAYLADFTGKSTGSTLLDCSNYEFLPKTQDQWFMFLLHQSIFQGAACLFKKEILLKSLPIPDDVKFHDYWLAINSVLQNGVHYIENPILYYRQHGNNVTVNENWNLIERIKQSFADNKNYQVTKEKIIVLKEIEKKCNDFNKKQKIENAIKYYEHEKGIYKYLTICYFFKNYKYMYLSSNKQMMILRFIKRYIILK